jgi:hypothetical protein
MCAIICIVPLQVADSSFLDQVPIVVTRRTRRSYVYADDDRAVVTRPAAMSEVAALKALRTGSASSYLEMSMPNMGADKKMGSNAAIHNAVQDMMSLGWTRRKSDLDNFKSGLWNRNDLMAKRILRDL